MTFFEKIYYTLYLSIKTKELPFFDNLRVCFFNKLSKSKTIKFVLRSNVTIHDFKKLNIGEHVSIQNGCFLSCEGGLSIGNFVSIGHNTSIITTEHSFSNPDTPIKYQPIINKPVAIGDNVWIGANVTILGGVSIANGTIIAAGAVVNKSIISKNSIIGGVPAKHIKFH